MVDAVTAAWLAVFFGGLFTSTGTIGEWFLPGCIPVYFADLGVKYNGSGNWKVFLRANWLPILMVVP